MLEPPVTSLEGGTSPRTQEIATSLLSALGHTGITGQMLRPTNRSSVGECAEKKVSIPSTHTRGIWQKPDATANCQGPTGGYAGQLLIAHPPISHPSLPPSSSISPPRHGMAPRAASSPACRLPPGAAPLLAPLRLQHAASHSPQPRHLHALAAIPATSLRHRTAPGAATSSACCLPLGAARLLAPLRLQHVVSHSHLRRLLHSRIPQLLLFSTPRRVCFLPPRPPHPPRVCAPARCLALNVDRVACP